MDGFGKTSQYDPRTTLVYIYHFVYIGLVGLVGHGENHKDVKTTSGRFVSCTSGISRMTNINFYRDWIEQTMADTLAACS